MKLPEFFRRKKKRSSVAEDGVFILPRREITRLKRLMLLHQSIFLLGMLLMSLWVLILRDSVIEVEHRAIIILDHISMKKYDVSAMQQGESFYLVFNRKVDTMGEVITSSILHPEKPRGEAYAAEDAPGQ